ncbi:MAG: hypothetical protein K2Y21_08175 [Phycisphaerales bacterium]|nr:hypothetical protein [Phycisphaerales bacterium]
MATPREFLGKPAVGWTVAGLAIAVAAYLFFRSMFGSAAYDLSTLSQSVTVRFMDTGDEITLTRGEFEKQLRAVKGTLTKDTGIINPKSGQPTGVLVASREWEETIARINAERDWAKQNSPFGSAPASTK